MFRIVNVEDTARENPETFFIPSRFDRNSLAVGDKVKLIFEGDDGNGERMWLEVMSDSYMGKYRGRLLNIPVMVDGLEIWSVVEFGPENVSDIVNSKSGTGGGKNGGSISEGGLWLPWGY